MTFLPEWKLLRSWWAREHLSQFACLTIFLFTGEAGMDAGETKIKKGNMLYSRSSCLPPEFSHGIGIPDIES